MTTSPTMPPLYSKTPTTEREYRDAMRNFVMRISAYAKGKRAGFQILQNNAADIYTLDGNTTGTLATDYLAAIDGAGQESLNFGVGGYNVPTPEDSKYWLNAYIANAAKAGKPILVLDYCNTSSYIQQSLAANSAKGYITFTAPSRSLDRIPTTAVPNVNSANINSAKDAKNFLYVINAGNYSSTAAFIAAVKATNYDLVVIDPLIPGQTLTSADIASLKTKANGGRRQVIAYMSIGEAEDYRSYWQDSWSSNPPSWLGPVNPDWPGCFMVRYWQTGWQNIIFGSSSSSLDRILSLGFDGTYMDVVDVYQYWENR